nr:DUF4878 domain-containing protein [uncultured Cardiobacterium sp.]
MKTTTLTLILCAALLTACGGDGPEKTAKTFFEEFFNGDVGKAAELLYLPPEAAQKGISEDAMKGEYTMVMIETQQQFKKGDNKINVTKVSVTTGKVIYIDADKTEARVNVIFKRTMNGETVKGNDSVLLIKTDKGWKIKL